MSLFFFFLVRLLSQTFFKAVLCQFVIVLIIWQMVEENDNNKISNDPEINILLTWSFSWLFSLQRHFISGEKESQGTQSPTNNLARESQSGVKNLTGQSLPNWLLTSYFMKCFCFLLYCFRWVTWKMREKHHYDCYISFPRSLLFLRVLFFVNITEALLKRKFKIIFV